MLSFSLDFEPRGAALLQTIKIGTSSLIHEANRTLNISAMARIAETVRNLLNAVSPQHDSSSLPAGVLRA